MKLIYLTLIAIFLSSTAMPQEKSSSVLVPWLSKTGMFGYCDSSGKTVIQPQFDQAGPFKNGYAVVGENGRYGVISPFLTRVIPLRYTAAYQYGQDIFITKKEYNAWWRFWQWRVLPEFNILSTRSHGPLLVTKVPRAKWRVHTAKKRLFSLKQSTASGQYWKKDWYPEQPAPLNISSAGNTLKVNDRLFLNHHKVADDVLELLNDTSALVFKKNKYSVLDIQTKKRETYLSLDTLTFQVDQGVIHVAKQSKEMYPYPTIAGFILKGKDGRTYLSPELSKPLPVHVEDYKGTTATEIMTHAITISSIPHSKYFLVVSASGSLLLDGDGKWNTDLPPYEGLDQLLANGDLLFTRGEKKGVLTRDLEFKPFTFDYRAFPLSFTKDLYSGKDISTQLYGVYNIATQRWQVSPSHSFIGNEIVPGVCIYRDVKAAKEYYGLMDVTTGKQITPPVYDMINNDGLASVTEDGRSVYFYINPLTGKEYRE